MVVLVYEGARCSGVHALLQPLGLCVFLIARTIALGIILVRQIHNHFPLAVCVRGSLRAAIEDIRGAEVSALLVIVRGVLVTSAIYWG